MRKEILFFLSIIVVGGIVGCSFTIGYSKGSKDQMMIGEAISRYSRSFNNSKHDTLKRIMAEVASKLYIIDKYNCVNFSRELKNKLQKAGIKSRMILGTKDGEGHAWVAVFIEATNGTFINPESKLKDIRDAKWW